MHEEFKIKKATSADCSGIAKVHVDCWKTTYQGLMPDGKLDSLSYEKSAEKWKEFFIKKDGAKFQDAVLAAVDGKGDMIGFCAGGMNRKTSKRTSGYEGEIKAIYILKQHQKKKIGTKLLLLFEEMFRKNGIFSYIIWVLKDNPSKEFYKKTGGKLITTKTYVIGGAKLKGLCYGYKILNGNENEF
ncbi:MAG TPA: GNAT family N-acetyltransferase [Clostridiales bacterium]|jgi:ribosomal protein S18 acetylase RimI-like enzyme|nr:GNAT family N-acetyltransferase [Clostridiales bacterium]HQP70827.1 GNAT family N-acetyltransferase [Clostridiales bacterium]